MAMRDDVLAIKDKGFLNLEIEGDFKCDAPNPGCPLTTRQLAEILFVSYHETHT